MDLIQIHSWINKISSRTILQNWVKLIMAVISENPFSKKTLPSRFQKNSRKNPAKKNLPAPRNSPTPDPSCSEAFAKCLAKRKLKKTPRTPYWKWQRNSCTKSWQTEGTHLTSSAAGNHFLRIRINHLRIFQNKNNAKCWRRWKVSNQLQWLIWRLRSRMMGLILMVRLLMGPVRSWIVNRRKIRMLIYRNERDININTNNYYIFFYQKRYFNYNF